MSIQIPGIKLDERDLHLLPYTKEVNEFIVDTYKIISKYLTKNNAYKYIVFNAAGYTIKSSKYDFKACTFLPMCIDLFKNIVKNTNNIYLKEFYLKMQSLHSSSVNYTELKFNELFTTQDDYGKSIIHINEVSSYYIGLKVVDLNQYYQPIVNFDENYVPYEPVSSIILSYHINDFIVVLYTESGARAQIRKTANAFMSVIKQYPNYLDLLSNPFIVDILFTRDLLSHERIYKFIQEIKRLPNKFEIGAF